MMIRALAQVFHNPLHVCVSGLCALGITITTLLWPNIPLLSTVWGSDITSLQFKLSLTVRLLEGSLMSMGGHGVLIIVITALLVGVVTVMTWYAWHNKKAVYALRTSVTSTSGGVVAAILGIGCIACGPLLLGTILATVGGAGLLLLLPLHGAELGYIAIFLLLYALYAIARVIMSPPVCEV